ncbi:MAG: hypothetical protein IT303_07835 [Dehalococcoidia bacterium]|nr:hypothetical protein [Dehalococcoidia bacterium]
MTSPAKEQIRELLNELPDDATAFELLDALYIRMKVLRGLRDIREGRYYTHDQVVEMLRLRQ